MSVSFLNISRLSRLSLDLTLQINGPLPARKVIPPGLLKAEAFVVFGGKLLSTC